MFRDMIQDILDHVPGHDFRIFRNMIQDILKHVPGHDFRIFRNIFRIRDNRNISLNMFRDISEHVPGHFGTYAGIFWLGMDANLFWD
jgi:hypothetical protein